MSVRECRECLIAMESVDSGPDILHTDTADKCLQYYTIAACQLLKLYWSVEGQIKLEWYVLLSYDLGCMEPGSANSNRGGM